MAPHTRPSAPGQNKVLAGCDALARKPVREHLHVLPQHRNRPRSKIRVRNRAPARRARGVAGGWPSPVESTPPQSPCLCQEIDGTLTGGVCEGHYEEGNCEGGGERERRRLEEGPTGSAYRRGGGTNCKRPRYCASQTDTSSFVGCWVTHHQSSDQSVAQAHWRPAHPKYTHAHTHAWSRFRAGW